jgi:hypothetical protein
MYLTKVTKEQRILLNKAKSKALKTSYKRTMFDKDIIEIALKRYIGGK